MKIYCEHYGHSIVMYRNKKYIICNHCGHRVYPTEKGRFITILEEQLKKLKKLEVRNEQSNIIRESM